MPYSVTTEHFEGPFDLLLRLVESEQLDITTISLTRVTEPFLRYLEEHRGQLQPDELADFLLIAAKLTYLKSKEIVPGFQDEEIEDGPDLASQLRMYRVFVTAAKQVRQLAAQGTRTFARSPGGLQELNTTVTAPSVTVKALSEQWKRLIGRLEPLARLPQATIERVMTLEEKIVELVQRLRKHTRTSLAQVMGDRQNRAELIVTFLAVLELCKQRTCQAEQVCLFEDIHLVYAVS